MARPRINQGDLEYMIERINDAFPDGPAFVLSGAYGGWAVHRYTQHDQRGGIEDLTGGHGTNRETYEWMRSYLAGHAAS